MEKDFQFEKISFDEFYKDSVSFGFLEDCENLARLVWASLKEPRGHGCISAYTPFPFFLAAGKQVQIPTGFRILKDDLTKVRFVKSNRFEFDDNKKSDKHFVINLKAKYNVCLDEGDCIARFYFEQGSDEK